MVPRTSPNGCQIERSMIAEARPHAAFFVASFLGGVCGVLNAASPFLDRKEPTTVIPVETEIFNATQKFPLLLYRRPAAVFKTDAGGLYPSLQGQKPNADHGT